MATNVDGKKITNLTQAASMQDTDWLIVETASGTRKISAKDLIQAVSEKSVKIVSMTAVTPVTIKSVHITQCGKRVQGIAFVEGKSKSSSVVISGTEYKKIMTCGGNIFSLSANIAQQVGAGMIGYHGTGYGSTMNVVPVLALYDGSKTTVLLAMASSAMGWQAALCIDA